MVGRKWYVNGLHFICQQCGRCCTGEPGYVWVGREELRRIAEFLKMEDDELRTRHTRKVGWRMSLIERVNGDCTFLQDGQNSRGCVIYPVRPLQCRTWPFWDLNLQSPDTWTHVGQKCSGINKGAFHNLDEIEAQRTRKKWW